MATSSSYSRIWIRQQNVCFVGRFSKICVLPLVSRNILNACLPLENKNCDRNLWFMFTACSGIFFTSFYIYLLMFFKEISEESSTFVSETVGRCHVVKESPVYVSSERGNKQDHLHQPHVPYFPSYWFSAQQIGICFHNCPSGKAKNHHHYIYLISCE